MPQLQQVAEAFGMGRDEGVIQTSLLHQQVTDTTQQDHIGSGPDRQMQVRRGRRRCGAGIHDHQSKR